VITKSIDTEAWSDRYRKEAIDVPGRRVLITNFIGTEQANDLSEPPNCKGFGRIRHFDRRRTVKWIPNPLPIDPACRALGLGDAPTIRAQVFQNAVCNWRCWYCFVPFNLLNANKRHADMMTPGDLLDFYLADPDPPPMIDLTGGQPDLTPEWVPWMMEELKQRGLSEKVYLWSDDNLSNDYFWRYLTDDQRAAIKAYPKYGRVACFKGSTARHSPSTRQQTRTSSTSSSISSGASWKWAWICTRTRPSPRPIPILPNQRSWTSWTASSVFTRSSRCAQCRSR
jgi:hypothetical protein